MEIIIQIAWLFILAIPIACITWTVTHEEIFIESREYCQKCIRESKTFLKRKFFYVFTCEYCFSHYVAILILFITDYKLIFFDWRGYLISGFSLVWIANLYMSIFGLLRQNIKKDIIEAKLEEKKLNENDSEGKNSAAKDGIGKKYSEKN